MEKSIKEEIVYYLKEHDMYYVEEFDEEGFPIDNGSNDLVCDLTNVELCDMLVESMEDIAEVQRKKDIEKACDAYCSQCKTDTEECREFMQKLHIECPGLKNLKQALEQ